MILYSAAIRRTSNGNRRDHTACPLPPKVTAESSAHVKNKCRTWAGGEPGRFRRQPSWTLQPPRGVLQEADE